MKKRTIILLCLAAVFVIAGIIGLTASAFAMRADSSEFYSIKTKTVDINKDFFDITVEADTEDIAFAVRENGENKVVFEYKNGSECDAAVENGVLKIKTADKLKWYERITAFSFGSEKVTVYLNKRQYSSVTVRCSTGDVCIDSVTADTAEIKASTGDIDIKNTECQKSISINVSTGDVRFSDSDAGEITVKTSTGDVTGTLLTDKIFITETSTGSVRVPKGAKGGKCKVKTSTGDIVLDIKRGT